MKWTILQTVECLYVSDKCIRIPPKCFLNKKKHHQEKNEWKTFMPCIRFNIWLNIYLEYMSIHIYKLNGEKMLQNSIWKNEFKIFVFFFLSPSNSHVFKFLLFQSIIELRCNWNQTWLDIFFVACSQHFCVRGSRNWQGAIFDK